ncbi:MAG: ribosomal protein L7/L12 [Burkholderiales bacterium]
MAESRRLPEAALTALREGRTLEAVHIVRDKFGVGLKEANDLVQESLARDPRSLGGGPANMREALGDYLASTSKFPLAAGFGAGAFGLWVFGTYFPNVGQDYDPGVMVLVAMGIPMVVMAAVLMIWARRWRARRAAGNTPGETAGRVAAASVAGRGSVPRQGVLPDAARAALDRDDPIAAIKVVREVHGLGLAEAKAVVDAAIVKPRGGR